MNMRKKEILATLVILSLMQGMSVASADMTDKNYDFVANDDIDFGDMISEQTGGKGMMLESGDTLTIADGKTVTFDKATYSSWGAGPFYVVVEDFGNVPKPLKITGGNFVAISDGDKDDYAAYIQKNSGANIIVNDTNLTFDNFYWGFALQDAETVIENSETKLINNDYAIYMQNDAKFNATSDKFTIQNINTGIFAKNNTEVYLDNKETIIGNGGCAIYQKDTSLVDIKGEKLDIINTSYAISNNNSITNIKVNEFNYLTTEANSNLTAIYGGLNAQINVNTNKAYLCGNIEAYDNANINFLDDPNSDEIQNVTILSDWIDAVSGESDDGNAKINFEVNSYINSQGDEITPINKVCALLLLSALCVILRLHWIKRQAFMAILSPGKVK